ncbi:nucleotide disphospho-sugar-binding domain-containing protein [Streptomyces sp. NPDC057638]|uniref:nucleotide disphospho-sugar-binding domain-containing protein n=1 Tax=Streptomyces sp. NPDC057638 TaxID=3346190 RepID=UPI0036A0CF2E
MRLKHIAILAFPGYGHVNPTLEMSRCLIEAGHRITYVVDERFVPRVTGVGAHAVTWDSARSRFSRGEVTGDEIQALGLDYLRESRDVILPRTLEAFRDDVPDLILYDLESFFTARAAARLWDRPTAQYFPYFASNEHFSLAMEMFDGAVESVHESIGLVMEYLAGEGEDPHALWGSFMTNYNAERNLVFLPRELQPLQETFDEARYTFTGHSLAANQHGVGSWPGADPTDPRRVALITLGTEMNDRADFFELCERAFASGDWRVVIAVGPGNLPEGRPLADHIEVHEWLDFSTVLPHADAVVCHAGIGTMLEAVSFGKPMVVVTYTPGDRFDARRAQEAGLALELPGDQVTVESLRASVDRIVGDPETVRHIARARTDMLAAGGPYRAARTVEGWLNELTGSAVVAGPVHGNERNRL